MKKHFSLTLVRTEGAVNIGLCARAIKNFGAKGLVLAQPFAHHLGKEALGYAAHAQAVDTADIQSVANQFMRLLDTTEYFECEDRKESFFIYLEKILTRGIREKSDALIVENLLLRLDGIVKRKSRGK